MDEYTTLYKAIRPRVSFSNTIIFGFNPKDYSRNEHDANYVFFSVNDPSVAKKYSFNYQNGIVKVVIPTSSYDLIPKQIDGLEENSIKIKSEHLDLLNKFQREVYEKPTR